MASAKSGCYFLHTVDGSEIPFPTTWDVKKPTNNEGYSPNIIWCRISEPSTVFLKNPVCSPKSQMITCNACNACILAFQMLKQMTVKHFHRSQIQGLQVQPGQPAVFVLLTSVGCRVADGGPNLCENNHKNIYYPP